MITNYKDMYQKMILINDIITWKEGKEEHCGVVIENNNDPLFKNDTLLVMCDNDLITVGLSELLKKFKVKVIQDV